MKPDYQTKNIRLAFWGIFAVVLIILVAMVLFAPAERPVGQASTCGGIISEINGVKYCCPSPSSRSDAPCIPMDVQSGTCSQDMLGQCAEWGLGCKNDGFRDVCFKNWTCNEDMIRVCAADGWGCKNGTCEPKPSGGSSPGGTASGGGTVVVRPDPYDRSSGDDVVVCAPSPLGDGLLDCSSGDNPLEDIIFGESSICVMAPGTGGNNLLCDQPVTATGLLNVSGIPKADPTDCRQSYTNCIAEGTNSRAECDKQFNDCPNKKDDGNGKGGKGGKGGDLGCDVFKVCPDGVNSYNLCDGVESCPKAGGGGGGGTGPGGRGGDKVCIQGGTRPSCPGGVPAIWDQDACQYVCLVTFPPLVDCLPNTVSIKCILKKFEWIF